MLASTYSNEAYGGNRIRFLASIDSGTRAINGRACASKLATYARNAVTCASEPHTRATYAATCAAQPLTRA